MMFASQTSLTSRHLFDQSVVNTFDQALLDPIVETANCTMHKSLVPLRSGILRLSTRHVE